MLRGLGAIVYKEILQVRRDPSTRFIFLIPLFQTIIFGFAIDMDVQHIRTVVYDLDRSVESRRLVERFANTQTFDIVEEVNSAEAVQRAIVAGRAKVGTIIPAEFSADRLAGRQATAQILIDGSESTIAANAMQT